MRRREFVALLGSAAAWPVAARAQQPAMPVIGFLSGGAAGSISGELTAAAFRKGLNEAGYVEGKNVLIESRWAGGQYDRLPALAAELVNRRVDVIFATGSAAAPFAAKAATAAIPIVFAIGGDPISLGLVPTMNRPGGNITGVSFLLNALAAKRLDLLHELVPGAKVIGFLVNSGNPSAQSEVENAQAAARALGLQLVVANAGNEQEIDLAFVNFHQRRTEALANAADVFFDTRAEQLVALAAQYGLPAIYHLRSFVTVGGLMSYGTSFDDAQRLAGVYTGRILKGEKPDDLPVQQSVKTEVVLNLKTAKRLGLAVPTSILLRADEVIE